MHGSGGRDTAAPLLLTADELAVPWLDAEPAAALLWNADEVPAELATPWLDAEPAAALLWNADEVPAELATPWLDAEPAAPLDDDALLPELPPGPGAGQADNTNTSQGTRDNKDVGIRVSA